MRRHAHILLPFIALVASVFIMAWPSIRARVDGDRPDSSALVIETVSASSSSTLAVRLAIPGLGIDAPVIEPAARNEKTFQQALENGVVHFPGTAMPGQIGNAYFFGHSSDYLWSPGSYKDVFAKLMSIRVGEEIEVTNASGTPFLYVVTDTKVVSPKDLSVLSQGDGVKKQLVEQGDG
jgi:LPXTG-site transpeptidase (sortase) family protein